MEINAPEDTIGPGCAYTLQDVTMDHQMVCNQHLLRTWYCRLRARYLQLHGETTALL